MDPVGELPAEYLEVPCVGAMIPGRAPEVGLSPGANSQRFAYAVLAHYLLSVPLLRSSELWTDRAANSDGGHK